MKNECLKCGFYDTDYQCICPHSDKWYACPIENKKPENIQALKEYTEWLPEYKVSVGMSAYVDILNHYSRTTRIYGTIIKKYHNLDIMRLLFQDLRDEIINLKLNSDTLVESALQLTIDKVNRRIAYINKTINELLTDRR